ncbi:MAG: hypothetical protein ACPLRN_00245 [Microgenomates group bacterium]
MNKKEVLFISIAIFLTIVAWMIADLYHASTEEKIKTKIEVPDLKKYNINQQILEKIKSKNE